MVREGKIVELDIDDLQVNPGEATPLGDDVHQGSAAGARSGLEKRPTLVDTDSTAIAATTGLSYEIVLESAERAIRSSDVAAGVKPEL